ncbi:hypothetical protein [Sulfurirhabdus autotrophica]|uniref:Uncharacterized protein n=1 Tax=Sulfurirhabdus autotrophica TaxID=1706046 RepID=A0A4R3XW21_9PROT|nr:hypothetical protein [Sulfurirhabdus autotrophica]TCV83390.1 hypothetical protein EDC63_11515 [Sulfurirhabdus autotrophica]
MKYLTQLLGVFALCASTFFVGCTSLNTFPGIARPGDTISLMIGGSENARKDNVSVSFKDANGQNWDLKALGLVRSVFNLRTDGRAYGQHYSSYLDSYVSWIFGHEPLQTMLVTDLPLGVASGQGSLTVALNGISDNSSGASNPFNVGLEIISGNGNSDQFKHQVSSGSVSADFSKLEPAPNAKVKFSGTTLIGAVSMIIDFDKTILNPNDLNIYVPESEVRKSSTTPDAFGKTQRMVYWHQDGQKLYVDIIAPQGIDPRYLQFFIVHPRGLSGSPAFSIISAQVYDISGNTITLQPTLTYFP